MKKNIPLLIGIAMPIIFILIISIVVFGPSLFLKPQYNFLYSNFDNYYNYNNQYSNTIEVENNKLILKPLPDFKGVQNNNIPPLYLYDVKTNTSKQVDFSEAQKYVVDSGPSSPDGYIVNYNNNYGSYGIFGLFGSGGDNRGYFISKGNSQKRLSGLTNTGYYNYYQFKFIGWIK